MIPRDEFAAITAGSVTAEEFILVDGADVVGRFTTNPYIPPGGSGYDFALDFTDPASTARGYVGWNGVAADFMSVTLGTYNAANSRAAQIATSSGPANSDIVLGTYGPSTTYGQVLLNTSSSGSGVTLTAGALSGVATLTVANNTSFPQFGRVEVSQVQLVVNAAGGTYAGNLTYPSVCFNGDRDTGIWQEVMGDGRVAITGNAGTGRVALGQSHQRLIVGGSQAGGIYIGGDASSANSPTGGIEASWLGGGTPAIAIGVTRDGDRTQFQAQYGGQLNFVTQNTRRGYVTSAGWNFDGNNVTGIAQLTLSGGISAAASTFDSCQIFSIGISYPGCTVAGGTANLMGMRWSNPNIVGGVDNVVSAVLGTASDRRIKRNVVDLADGLDMIRQLRPRRFDLVGFIAHPADGDGPPAPLTFGDDILGSHIGLVADEVEPVAPEFVTGTASPFELQSVNYAGLVTPLILAVQELAARLDALESRP